MNARCRCLAAGASLLFPFLLAAQDPGAAPAPASVQAAARPVAISGEETLEPTLVMVADEFQRVQPEFRYSFRSTVSEQSVQDLIEGKVAVAAITRDIRPEEVAAFSAKWGYAPTRISFAVDALVILVNKDNPVRELRLEQLDAAWSPERRRGWPREINTWGELGVTDPAWSARPIVLVGHPGGSGAREMFTEKITQGATPRANILRPSTIMGMVQQIETNVAAMGYTSLGAVFAQTRGVAVVPPGEAVGVEPVPENVTRGSYPLSRSVSFYVNKQPGFHKDQDVLQFLRYVLSAEGQKWIKLNGFAGLDPGVIAANLRRLN